MLGQSAAASTQPVYLFDYKNTVPYLIGDLEYWIEPRVDVGWSNKTIGSGTPVNLGSAPLTGSINVTYNSSLGVIEEKQWSVNTYSVDIETQQSQTFLCIPWFDGTMTTGTRDFAQVGSLGLNAYQAQNELGPSIYDGHCNPNQQLLNQDMNPGTYGMYGFATWRRDSSLNNYRKYVNGAVVSVDSVFTRVSGGTGICWGRDSTDFRSGTILKYNKQLSDSEVLSVYEYFRDNLYPEIA